MLLESLKEDAMIINGSFVEVTLVHGDEVVKGFHLRGVSSPRVGVAYGRLEIDGSDRRRVCDRMFFSSRADLAWAGFNRPEYAGFVYVGKPTTPIDKLFTPAAD